MSLQDPIADMLTRIRNAQAVRRSHVSFASSKLKKEICRVLQEEGYIASYAEHTKEGASHPTVEVELKYYKNNPVIETLKRVSRPGLRVYRNCKSLPVVNENLGVVIVSTSQGVMSGFKARAAGLGGEVLCTVF